MGKEWTNSKRKAVFLKFFELARRYPIDEVAPLLCAMAVVTAKQLGLSWDQFMLGAAESWERSTAEPIAPIVPKADA